jgi:hypothetical protein
LMINNRQMQMQINIFLKLLSMCRKATPVQLS